MSFLYINIYCIDVISLQDDLEAALHCCSDKHDELAFGKPAFDNWVLTQIGLTLLWVRIGT